MWWAAALLLTAQGGGGPADLSVPTWAPFPQGEFALNSLNSRAALRLAARSQERETPACLDDVCQPRVALPGVDPSFDLRGKRTEFALAVLDRLDAGAISDVARTIALTGVRVDYTPPQGLDTRAGFGSFNVFVRWRIDAFGTPSWLGGVP